MTKKLFLAACFAAGFMHSALAQTAIQQVETSNADAPGSYVAGIWVDPDGCQHWVMDLGIEGMMDSVLTRDGKPVCGRGCGQISGDVLFASGSATITASGRVAVQSVANQLRSTGHNTVSVVGHTDSDASEAYNQDLSQRRASAVASALRQAGVNIAGVSGRGESSPIASNNNPAGKAQNRRVELVCQ